MNKQTADCSI